MGDLVFIKMTEVKAQEQYIIVSLDSCNAYVQKLNKRNFFVTKKCLNQKFIQFYHPTLPTMNGTRPLPVTQMMNFKICLKKSSSN